MHCLPGVNLPVFFDAAGYDLAPNALLGTGPRAVDPMHVYRPLLEARAIGFQAVRVWLCERGEGILMDGASIAMGVDMLGIAFVVVALGGLGNLLGSIAAGLTVGIAQSLVSLFWPEASVAVIFAVMAAVLLVRPQGLFGIR